LTFRFDADGKITNFNETVDSAYLNNLLTHTWVQEVMAKGTQAK
jgi:hypothetical protein